MSKPEDFVIENGVLIQYIGNDSEINIPDGVRKIDDKAFLNCKSIISVKVTDKVERIGNYAFKGCDSLKEVTIPYSETEIGYKAFGDLTEFTIKCPEGSLAESYVEKNRIKFLHFSGENNLPFSEKNNSRDFVIKDGVLIKYRGIKSNIIIPDGVTVIGNCVFQECTDIKSVYIPDGVKIINLRAFKGCTGLTSIIIPDSVTSIGEDAFHGCTGLTSITIPDSVKSIGLLAFGGCDNAMIAFNCKHIDYNFFFLSSYYKYAGKIYFSEITIKDIPKQLKQAAVRGFLEMYGREELPQNIISDYSSYIKRQKEKYYSEMLFDSNLLKFIISQRIITIDETDSIIDSVENTEIKALLIEYKKSFSEKEVEKLEKKKDEEFDKLMGVKELTLKDYKNLYGLEFVRKDDGYILKKYKGKDNAVSIPESIRKIKVTGIEKSAFSGCTGLTSIEIPDSVTSIGHSAFEDCTGLTIKCKENSYAHKYTIENDIKFELI